MSALGIREARDDVGTIRSMQAQLGTGHRIGVGAAIESSRHRVLVAITADDAVAGYWLGAADGSAWEIIELFVSPAHRGRDHATALIGRAVEIAIGEHCERIVVETHINNHRACGLLKKCLFNRTAMRSHQADIAVWQHVVIAMSNKCGENK